MEKRWCRKVKIGDCYSTEYSITSGVPQGSALGPLRFLIYINDLHEFLPEGVCVKMYADDVRLFANYTPSVGLGRERSLASFLNSEDFLAGSDMVKEYAPGRGSG